jgi:predicted GNAT family acetyltransferase
MADADEPDIRDNRAANRFEMSVDGALAVLEYERRDGALIFNHTEVPEQFRGRGYGEKLVEAGLAAARAEGLRIVAVCPYVRAYLRKHPGGHEL